MVPIGLNYGYRWCVIGSKSGTMLNLLKEEMDAIIPATAKIMGCKLPHAHGDDGDTASYKAGVKTMSTVQK
jgi:hypothetical protein